MAGQHDLTALIEQWQQGSDAALEQLTPHVHDELQRLARRYMKREGSGHTLQATALVNEAFLKLVGAEIDFKSRAHFYNVAAQMMRRILVDHARSKKRDKRGGGVPEVTLDESALSAPDANNPDVLQLDIALDKLAQHDESLARIVELIYFGGLSYEETAEAIGSSRTKVYENLTFAKAWLQKELA